VDILRWKREEKWEEKRRKKEKTITN